RAGAPSRSASARRPSSGALSTNSAQNASPGPIDACNASPRCVNHVGRCRAGCVMGLRERQHEKVDRRAEDFLRDKLHPGEAIRGVTFGQARPRGWLGLEFLFGVFAYFATTYCYLVLTNQRLLMVRLRRSTGKPTEV